MTDARLMTIGTFSRLSRLSLKALRLYGRLGLLLPVQVDPHSGYRYYAPAQLETARTIALLRGLDMPLEQVQLIIRLPPEQAAAKLETFWQVAEQRHQERRQLAGHLLSRLRAGPHQWLEVQAPDIRTRQVSPQRYVSTQRRVTVDGLPEYIGRSYAGLYAVLARSGARPLSHGFVKYHGEVNRDSDGPVEVCLPFSGELPPDVPVHTEPQHKEAYLSISRAQLRFPELVLAYQAVEDHLGRQGWTPTLVPREVYTADVQQARPEALVCDISFPYEVKV